MTTHAALSESGRFPAGKPISWESLFGMMKASIRTTGDEYWFVVRPEVFAIPYLDGFILYSPLQGRALLMTAAGLGAILSNPSRKFSECLDSWVMEGSRSLVQEFDLAPSRPPSAFTGAGEEFQVTRLTLSLTSACQLACVYCYIRGGDSPRSMPWDIAQAAIDFVAHHLAARKEQRFEVEFHGQGEPTANWPLFRRAIMFVEALSERLGLQPQFSLVTNGILGDSQVQFLAAHNVRVGLSLDGLKESMDSQRPLRRGGSSFERVIKAMGSFEEMGLSYNVRSTVTPRNVEEMGEFVGFISEKTRCRYVNFEPVCGAGRAHDSSLDTPSIAESFVFNFRKARNEGFRKGVEVGYSASRIDGLRSCFCGGYGPKLNFCVSTEGLVSSCFEVLESADPRAEIFVYGRYDPTSCGFVFDPDRIAWLRELNVTRIDRCGDCYVKWNCGGDCLAKAALKGLQHLKKSDPLDRCSTNRTLMREELVRLLFVTDREAQKGRRIE